MSDSIKTPPRLALKAHHHPTHHFDHLSRRICQEEWIFQAFTAVLSTQAAQTAGIAGVTKKALTSDEAHLALVRELQRDLRQGRFRPVPLRRIYLPKSNGKMRPRGMPTLQDRVVHMLLQMRVEPSGESACLKCCHGFRPGRKTMACIAALDSYSTNRTKFDCVIAGDSKGAFAYVQHDILLKGLAERIADRRLLKLLARFRKAGLMEQGLLHHTELGVAQGGSCSPFLANIDLPPLERSWWENQGNLPPKAQARRRKAHVGNCALIRYADDWLLLTNGSKQEAQRLPDEFQTLRRDTVQLELPVEKTHMPHVNDGFDFVGSHVRRYVSGRDRAQMLVTASDKARARLKAKVKEMTARKRFRDAPLLQWSALGAVLRGWLNYSRHCNAKEAAPDLDFWVNRRLFCWGGKRHRLPRRRRIVSMDKRRQEGKHYNCGIRRGEQTLFL